MRLISEIVTVIKEQKIGRCQLAQPYARSAKELVVGCSRVFVAASIIMTTSLTVLIIIKHTRLPRTLNMDDLILSVVDACMLLIPI